MRTAQPGAGDKGGVGGLRGVLALEPRQPKKNNAAYSMEIWVFPRIGVPPNHPF